MGGVGGHRDVVDPGCRGRRRLDHARPAGPDAGGRARWWLLVPIGAVLVTTVLFYGAHRIRAPAEPVVVVLAAVGVVGSWGGRRRDNRPHPFAVTSGR